MLKQKQSNMKKSDVLVAIEMYTWVKQYMSLEEFFEAYECRVKIKEDWDVCHLEFEYPLCGGTFYYEQSVGNVQDVYDFMQMVFVKLNIR